jgi:hypothetical protein
VTTRSTGWLAWLLWALVLVLLAGALALWLMNNGVGPKEPPVLLLLVPGFATVGAIIVARHRGHVVGWLFLGLSAVVALGSFSADYAIRARLSGALPAGLLMTWVSNWIGGLAVLPLGLLLLVFPTGQLPSPRWRLVAWVLTVSAAYLVVKFMFSPVLDLQVSRSDRIEVANPVLAIDFVSAVILPYALAVLGSWAALATAALAPLVRYRRAGQVERQQLKWLVFVLVLAVVVGLAAAALTRLMPDLGNGLALLVLAEVALGVPLAVGAAILRYRLYDIDRLINRTVVYGALTVLLGVIYAGMVLALGQLFGGLGADPPSWVVAAATLAVAALFQPARRRIQQGVDRRFNRRKYNMAQTIEAFSARLRDEVDLDTLSAEVLAVVDQTMQPTTASLWLQPSTQIRPGGKRRGGLPHPDRA